MLWYLMIALNIFLMIRGFSETTLYRMRPYQHLFVWSYTMGATLPALIRKQYSPLSEADYCWFAEADDPRRLLLDAPLFVTLIFCQVPLLQVLYIVVQRRSELGGVHSSDRILRRLVIMVVVFTLLWGIALVGRIMQAVGVNWNGFDLALLPITLNGFFNFLIWGLTHQKMVQWFQVKLGNSLNNLDLTTSLIISSTSDYESTPTTYHRDTSMIPETRLDRDPSYPPPTIVLPRSDSNDMQR